MDNILKYFKSHWIGFALTLFSILLVSLLHWVGVFDIIEMKTYDYRFHSVRGPLTGRTARDSTFIKQINHVVLLEVDNEAWQQVADEWPYPRGKVWARVVRNLYRAGAKVIVFDIQFDAPEAKSEYLHDFAESIKSDELRQLIPRHGDIMFAEAIAEARSFGTEIVINSKLVTEDISEYISYPVPNIMHANPVTGLINDIIDNDGFNRHYPIFFSLTEAEKHNIHLTLGIKAVKCFLGIADSILPQFNFSDNTCNYGPLTIKTHGFGNTFLLNYYGPASSKSWAIEPKLKSSTSSMTLSHKGLSWKTFPRYSLAHVIDTGDYDLRDPNSDVDWMTSFLPGEIPEWIMSIEDPVARKTTMDALGISTEFDVTKTPFYNKIVIIGATVEVLHDFKYTPFYKYKGLQQQTPGMEYHANAIQTILDNNYLNVLGGRLNNLLSNEYPLIHTGLIALLSIIALIILSIFKPILAGLLIIMESIIYFGVVCGAFMNDYWWLLKVTLGKIILSEGVFSISLPESGESYVLPMVAPIVGIGITYVSNILYRVLNEQKDKKFLKDTFGAYISPELIDQMYEEKQEPKLGGNTGYHTAFFSDIQSFSAFSEVMEPEAMVKLMNEYLTEMTNILLDHQGTLDKYIGDSIVAFYGAPVTVEEHELLACKTALAMEKKIVE
ncbi:MAG: adenylate/guanylate cyclase domain-containing protein, partial [Candidatus Marinimicrobia bacterium]|nr:adenylate/guanylate cyclase domain-containing protein [Candidatus Neomarinimicrobiota bacterium]